MKKRVYGLISAILITILCLSLCGCSTGQEQETEPLKEEEMTTLRFPLIVGGELPKNWDAVEEALNTYLKEKLELQLEFVMVDATALEDFYLMKEGGAQGVDFVNLLSAENYLSQMVSAGVLMPLDDLLEEHGEKIKEVAGDILSAGALGETQYMIPSVKDVYSFGCSVECNADLVEKYGIDLSGIHNLSDLEPVLAKIHEEEPDVITFAGNSTGSGNTTLAAGVDRLTDALGVLLTNDPAQEAEVVDWYETDEFMELAKTFYSWYRKGYISSNMLTSQRSSSDLVREGEAFCYLSTIGPGADEGTDTELGGSIVEVALSDVPQLLTSNELGLTAIGISSTCEEPEKAMEFLELLYTDEYLVNLFSYGIEGENYTLTNGKVDQQGDYFLLYSQPMNQTLKAPLVSSGSDYESYISDFLDNEIQSAALGFVFDERPVQQQITYCQAVVAKYFPVIDSGLVDPEKEMPVFVEELKKAGIDEIIAEKQRQLDEWRERQ